MEALQAPLLQCDLSNDEIIDRVLKFIETLSGVDFYAYQRLFAWRVVQSVLFSDGSIITALWARQCGKTETVANVCVGLAIILPVLASEFPDDPRFMPFKKGFLVGIYAPIDAQAKISFARMRNVVTSEYGESVLEEVGVELATNRSDVLVFSNGSRVMAKSASPDTQIEGDTHHLVICEEAQRLLRQKVDKEISPMLASTNGTMVKIGTAWHSRGGFHISIQQNIELRRTKGLRNHFEFPYDVVVAEKRATYEREVRERGVGNPFHLKYEKFIAREVQRLGGKNNDEFRMNYCCEWQESRIIAINMRVFSNAALKSAEAGRTRYGFQVAGLDIGKTTDATVLTVGMVDRERPILNKAFLPGSDEDKQFYYQKTILDWLEIYGSFEGSEGQYQQLVDYLMETSVQILCIDATTLGNPVYERLEAMLEGQIVCVPFLFSLATKSNLYKYYLQELNQGRLKYVSGPRTREEHVYKKFIYEHEQLDKVQHGNYVVCEAPEGEHDDYPDSAALMCWAEKVADQVLLPEVIATGYGGTRDSGSGPGSSSRNRGAGRYSRRH